ncbi:serine/threonine-protein kinase [Lentisphaera marina]|uniref:serine/threonine-protein kinase n=1 Tax=Lentisphaera marina TaxID=1111041 RepID=UPI0023671BC1|nr:serine/threonine-protein kinase [Lentisphaera marina]MDD7983516.1 serine/threonine-protein kinase [Lentisphaera marina]
MKKHTETVLGELNPKLLPFYDDEAEDYDSKVLFPIQAKLLERLHFEELEKFDHGGEKNIFRAFDFNADRHVALARPIADNQEAYERFLREARITANLHHPNIIPVFNIELDKDDKPFFTMELLRGNSLEKLIIAYHKCQEPSVELVDLLDVLVKVCDAVAYAHSRQTLHLDIKPSNIQVGAFGDVLLIDWGLAKIINNTDDELYLDQFSLNCNLLNDMTRTGSLKGTPGFMAPEQAGLSQEKNEQTDIYALGAVLFYILSGKTHIQAATPQEVLFKTRKGIIAKLESTEKIIPESLEAVCLKALSLKQDQRYESAIDFRDDIQAYLRGYATKAEHAHLGKQVQLIYKRNKRLCQSAITFTFATIVLTLLFITALQNRATQERLAKERAEKSLTLYKKEKLNRELMVNEVDQTIAAFKKNLIAYKDVDEHFSRLLVGTAISNSRKYDFEMALALCDLAIRENPKNVNAWAEKAFVHMIKQEFTQADFAFAECADEAPHVFVITRLNTKYKKIKPDDSKLLTIEQTVQLAKELPRHRRWLKMYILIRHGQVSTPEEHSQLVREYVLLANSDMKSQDLNFIFTKSEQGPTLSLAYSNGLATVKQLATNQFINHSILDTLAPKVLNLSHTDFSNIHELSELKLDILDISHTKVNELWSLKKFKQKPKQLIIHKGQIKELKKYPIEGISIIFTD